MNAQENEQLFVYGTLRSGFQHAAYEYISRYFKLVGAGKVKGRLYDMGDYPAAIPVEEDHFIFGELYRINHPDELAWALAQLDDYEGVHTEEGEAALYKREKATIQLHDQTTAAWIYWFAGDISGKPPLETGDIMDYIKGKNKEL